MEKDSHSKTGVAKGIKQKKIRSHTDHNKSCVINPVHFHFLLLEPHLLLFCSSQNNPISSVCVDTASKMSLQLFDPIGVKKKKAVCPANKVTAVPVASVL